MVMCGYVEEYVNVYCGLYYLFNFVIEKYEVVCGIIVKFFNVKDLDEIVLNFGIIEGINFVVYGWVMEYLSVGDEIVLLVMEYYVNIVFWYFLCECMGVVLKWVDIVDDGSLDL